LSDSSSNSVAIADMAFADRFRSLPVSLKVGISLVLAWLLTALFAPWIAPFDPNAIDLENVLQPPGNGWLMGTDQAGRDIFSRVIFAARIDLWMGFMGVLAPLTIGVSIGLFSGYFGGITDAIMMRLVDITLAFPFLILVLAIVAILGPGVGNFIVALAIVAWVSYARLVRAEVMVIRNAEYVQAARSMGFRPFYIITRHVLPNALSPVVVYAMTDMVLVILAGASLGFIGLGVQPPTAEWGVMIADGQPYVTEAWWICLFPGLAAISFGVGLSLIGDGLARMLRVSQ
jgi:peptide/nickel transport system permease protein